MANSAHQDLFAAMLAIWTPDHTLGLAGDVEVRTFERVGVDRTKLPPPHALIEIRDASAHTFSQDETNVEGLIHLYTDLRRDISEQDSLAEGFRVKYDQAVLTGTAWTWSDMQLGQPRQQAPQGEHVRHCTIPFATMGTRN